MKLDAVAYSMEYDKAVVVAVYGDYVVVDCPMGCAPDFGHVSVGEEQDVGSPVYTCFVPELCPHADELFLGDVEGGGVSELVGGGCAVCGIVGVVVAVATGCEQHKQQYHRQH